MSASRHHRSHVIGCLIWGKDAQILRSVQRLQHATQFTCVTGLVSCQSLQLDFLLFLNQQARNGPGKFLRCLRSFRRYDVASDLH